MITVKRNKTLFLKTQEISEFQGSLVKSEQKIHIKVHVYSLIQTKIYTLEEEKILSKQFYILLKVLNGIVSWTKLYYVSNITTITDTDFLNHKFDSVLKNT